MISRESPLLQRVAAICWWHLWWLMMLQQVFQVVEATATQTAEEKAKEEETELILMIVFITIGAVVLILLLMVAIKCFCKEKYRTINLEDYNKTLDTHEMKRQGSNTSSSAGLDTASTIDLRKLKSRARRYREQAAKDFDASQMLLPDPKEVNQDAGSAAEGTRSGETGLPTNRDKSSSPKRRKKNMSVVFADGGSPRSPAKGFEDSGPLPIGIDDGPLHLVDDHHGASTKGGRNKDWQHSGEDSSSGILGDSSILHGSSYQAESVVLSTEKINSIRGTHLDLVGGGKQQAVVEVGSSSGPAAVSNALLPENPTQDGKDSGDVGVAQDSSNDGPSPSPPHLTRADDSLNVIVSPPKRIDTKDI